VSSYCNNSNVTKTNVFLIKVVVLLVLCLALILKMVFPSFKHVIGNCRS